MAATNQLTQLGIGPNPIGALAECVRRIGLDDTLQVNELLPTREATELARAWMTAALGDSGPDITRDDAMAQWFGTIALLVAVARQARTPPLPIPSDEGDHGSAPVTGG